MFRFEDSLKNPNFGQPMVVPRTGSVKFPSKPGFVYQKISENSDECYLSQNEPLAMNNFLASTANKPC